MTFISLGGLPILMMNMKNEHKIQYVIGMIRHAATRKKKTTKTKTKTKQKNNKTPPKNKNKELLSPQNISSMTCRKAHTTASATGTSPLKIYC